MFDAGSAVFTLAAHVVRAGFEDYGRLVDSAERRKEHRIKLGAETSSSGFDKFILGVDTVQKKTEEMGVRAKGTFDSVSGGAERMAAATGRSLGAVGDVLSRTGEKLAAVGETAQVSARKVESAQGKTAETSKTVATEIVHSNERIIRSNEEVAKSYRNPIGGGPGGPHGPAGGGGGAAGDAERQAQKTSNAYKKGFNTLAGLGKWATVGILGVGAVSVKVAADFQRQMDLIHTEADYSARDVEVLKKRVLDLAPAVGVGPTELAKGLYHVTSVLQGRGGTNAAMEILKYAAEGAKVGMADMQDVASSLSAIWKSQPRDIHSVAEAMGVMHDIVGQGNLRLEDLAKALGTGLVAAGKNAHLGLRDIGAALDTMTSRGIPAEQAATRLRTTFTLMAAPTGKAAAALSQLGISHDRLATDMQQHGLAYALDDLQHHLDKTFPPGGHLTIDQERQALLQYGKQLQASGVHGRTLSTDLVKFKQRLEESGGSAIKQSQLITEAFGGSRMGTTMALLMQNADDVHRRFDALNRANAAGRFHNAWKDAQKGFSVQASQLWAGVQRLGIELGDKLIPKVRDAVKWLIEAGKWMGHHKVLADALAVAFGTLLTAAIAAFFARFLMKTAEGIKAIGQFGKALGSDLWGLARKGLDPLLNQLGAIKDRIIGVKEEATAAGDAMGGMGTEGAAEGGAAAEGEAALGGGAGAIEGMINGIKGIMAPGSIENPLAVVIMAADRYGVGAQGAAGETQTSTEAASSASQQQAQTPTGASQPTAAATAETAAGTSAAEEAQIARQAAQKEFEQAFRGQYGVAPGPHITSDPVGTLIPPDASSEVKASFAKLRTATEAAASSADDLAVAEEEGAKTTSTEFKTLYDALASADRGLQKLADEFLIAEELFGTNSKQAQAAFGELDRALAKLPPAVQKLAEEFMGIEEQFGTDAKETQTAFDRLIAAIDGTAGEIEGAGAAVAEDLKAGGAKAASTLEGGAAVASGEEEAGGAAVAEDLKVAGAKAATTIEEGAAVAAEGEATGGARGGIPAPVGAAPAAEGAAAAGAGEAAVLGETAVASGGIMAAGRSAIGAVGGAILPAAIGLGVGSMAQSSLGLKGGTAGTLGGGIVGGGIGLAIGGPLGAAIGAGIGSTLGPTVVHLFGTIFGSPDIGKAAADGLTKGFGGAASAQLRKSIQQLIDDGRKSADGAIRAAKYTEAGMEVAQQLEAGWNQYKFQDEPTMFKQFRAEVKNLPPYAQAAAGESAIKFASELEKQGRLPKGAADKMLKNIESSFPGLTQFLGKSAEQAIAAFNLNFTLQKAERNTKSTLNRIANDFPVVSAAIKHAGSDVNKQSAAVVSSLQNIIKNGTGPMKKQAEQDLNDLLKTLNQNFGDMVKTVQSATSNFKNDVSSNTHNAYQIGSHNFHLLAQSIAKYVASGGEATQQGLKNITDQVNGALKNLGEKPLAQVTVKSLTPAQLAAVVSGQVSSGAAASPHATGGQLPGSEFGAGDVMTLVDPLGRPRAKMAGDEAVFNRHQMPYVDMGLRALGFNGAEGLWNSVNAPHNVGFARGGLLRRLATGGYAGYSLPLPRSAMMPGSWSLDQGVDIPAPANTPEYAIGPGKIILEGIQGFGPNAPVLRISSGPLAGRSVYYGHAGPDKVRVGDTVHAGQQISEVGAGIVGISTGPHIEFGYYPLGGMGAGSSMATTLHQLMAGSQITPQGGAGLGGAGPVWQDIKSPKVVGSGKIADLVRGLLNKTTDEVNKWGEAHFASTGFSGTLTGPVEHQVYQFFSQHGFNKIAIAGMLGNAEQESSMNPNAGGGGLWQQISNFGQGAPPLLVQMQTMLPQIMSIRDAMNRAGSPAAAAAIFMNSFERPAAWAANLPHRQAAAGQAFAAGFAKGGRLPHLASGGRPWAPLPSAVGTLPGFRPPRARRGRGGIHIVGGSSSPGASKGASAGKKTSSGKGKTTARTKQPLTQSTAQVLEKLGLGTFVDDQNQLGKLDNLYTQQENLFNLFDASSGAGLPKQDLDTLMGIREQEWDILYKEFQQLPFVVDALQANVQEIQGTAGKKGHWQKIPGSKQKPTRKHPHAGMRFVPAVKPSAGVTGTEKEIAATETEITNLQHDVTLDTRAAATARHSATARAMSVADNYASAISGYTNDLSVIADQRSALAQQRIALRKQSESITTTGSAGAPSLQSIVSQVMSGNTNPDVSSGGSQAKKNIQKQITNLSGQDQTLSSAATHLRQQMRQVTAAKNAASRALRAEGFNVAWSYTVKKWGLQDKITRLKAKLVKLKALLAAEKSHLTAAQGALTQVETWETGGLQGDTSIVESLGEMGMNILGLYQEGADLPTPGRSGPTLKQIEDVLSAQPPNGLGLTLPPGLTQGTGTQTAQQAYADFTAFQASRMALFSQFGSNFVGAGVNPAASSAGLGAGVQFFGGAASPTAGAGAPGGGFARGGYLGDRNDPGAGGTTINITNNFSSGPPDPHTWSAGTSHELNAMV